MTNREKIIVVLAAVALAYGAIELLLPRANVAPVTTQPQSLEGLNAFITKVADATRVGTAEAGAIVIQKAEAAWKQDPFLEIQKAKPPDPKPTPPREGPSGLPTWSTTGSSSSAASAWPSSTARSTKPGTSRAPVGSPSSPFFPPGW